MPPFGLPGQQCEGSQAFRRGLPGGLRRVAANARWPLSAQGLQEPLQGGSFLQLQEKSQWRKR